MRSGSRVLRRVIAAVLSAALVVPAALSFPAQAYAAIDSGDTEAVKEMAYHSYDTPDVVYYSDDFFRGDSMQYNSSLAALSFFVCNSTYETRRAKGENQSRNLRELLTDNGFTDFEVNDDYKHDATLETSAVACAHKSIKDGGKTYTLLAVIPRSGTFGREFERSLMLGSSGSDKGDHAGYDACKDKVVDFVREYVQDHGIKGNLKVWTIGYSGGGGISNLFAAELIRYPAYVVCNPTFDPADLYCYNFSPMRAASLHSDPKNKKYARIHNVFDGADVLSILPTSDEFDRYGTDYKLRDREAADYEEVKARVLDLMKIDNMAIYEEYVRNQDPDDFMPMKPDTEALKKGELVMVPDPDSYIPADQATYMIALEDTFRRVCAEAGDGDSRKGFYNVYQQSMMDLVGFFFEDGINYRNIRIMVNAMTGTKRSMPLVLCMYTSFLVDKSISESSSELDSLIEESFNRLASEMENEDGSIRKEYRLFSEQYKYIRDNYYIRDGNDPEGAYRLNGSLGGSGRNALLKYLKKLTGILYADCMREALTAAGKDEETIAKLTSEEDRGPASWFITSLVFGNGLQSSKIEPLNFENEQFCQMATMLGNLSRFPTMHMFFTVFDWYRGASPYYADFSKGTEAQNTGYRRVLIRQPEGVSVSGTVTDKSGRQIAAFTENGITSRNDEWAGMTTADSGSWLRLQIDRPCKVNIQLSKDAAVSLEVDDYSLTEGSVQRAVTGDDSGSWKGLKVKSGETLTIDMPAAGYRDGKYDLTSAVYTLSRKAPGSSADSDTKDRAEPAANNSIDSTSAAKTTTVYSKNVPAVKSANVKAGKKSFTVRWKKLSAKKLKKISSIQLQYSTNRKFKNARTVTLKKTRKSYKLRGLKKGSTYYVRVRNVKKSGSTAYVSSWSKTMEAKVK